MTDAGCGHIKLKNTETGELWCRKCDTREPKPVEPVRPERACPSCGALPVDMHFRIDETVWCLFCDWEGHEDATLVCSDPCDCEDNCQCCMEPECPRHGHGAPFAYHVWTKTEAGDWV